MTSLRLRQGHLRFETLEITPIISLILGLDIFLVQFICPREGEMFALTVLMLMLMLIIAVFTKDYCYRNFLEHSKGLNVSSISRPII